MHVVRPFSSGGREVAGRAGLLRPVKRLFVSAWKRCIGARRRAFDAGTITQQANNRSLSMKAQFFSVEQIRHRRCVRCRNGNRCRHCDLSAAGRGRGLPERRNRALRRRAVRYRDAAGADLREDRQDDRRQDRLQGRGVRRDQLQRRDRSDAQRQARARRIRPARLRVGAPGGEGRGGGARSAARTASPSAIGQAS